MAAPVFPAARSLIAEYGMFPAGTRVLCAVSGGADSMCLLAFLRELSAEVGFPLTAAHYDHRLRGEESRRDAAFVKEQCEAWGIPLLTGSGDVAAACAGSGLGPEETARRMRYDFLRSAAEACGAGRIATAHTADDCAETMLLHLARGTGLTGLTGIAPRRGALVRPFVTTTRAEIEAYLAAHGIPHAEDSSNADDRFERNYIRHHVLPALRECNPNVVTSMALAARSLRADHEVLTAQALRLTHAAREQEGSVRIDTAVLRGTSRPLAVRAVRELLERAGGVSALTRAHLESVLALLDTADPSARVDLPGGMTVRREYGELVFSRLPLPGSFDPSPLGAGAYPVPGTGWLVAAAGELPDGALLRPRREGDTVTLPGRPPKTLKKLFIDGKIPRAQRQLLPVAADEDGVLAVAGFGPNTAHPRYGRFSVLFEKEIR